MDTRHEDRNPLWDHGGNINLAYSRFPHAPRPWIDLSTGINPVAYPIGDIAPRSWAELPQTADLQLLEAAARSAYRAPSPSEVIAASGTQMLIQVLSRIVPARRVGILGFTYAEHETCWRAAGADVATVGTPEELEAFDVGIVVNPNNPDGRLMPSHQLAEIARTLAKRRGMLIVDEAFMDVLGQRESLASRLPENGAIVLRSFGKIFGLAGLRLSFGIVPFCFAATLRNAMGPWPVSGPAIEIGRRALVDHGWLAGTVSRLRDEACRLDRLLLSAGFTIVGGTPLFRLAARPDARSWFDHFGRAGILTRPFPHRDNWLRFGIPHAPRDWLRLENVLRLRPGDND